MNLDLSKPNLWQVTQGTIVTPALCPKEAVLGSGLPHTDPYGKLLFCDARWRMGRKGLHYLIRQCQSLTQQPKECLRIVKPRIVTRIEQAE